MLIGPDRAECILDGTLGDLVEGDAANAVVGKVERLLQMPGDGFAFTVRVGGQIDHARLGRGPLEIGDRLFLGRHNFVRGFVALRDIKPELALGQVAHVAHARLHHISGTEKLVDRLGLLGALDDHQGGKVAVERRFGIIGRIFAGRRSWHARAFGAALPGTAFSVRFPRSAVR